MTHTFLCSFRSTSFSVLPLEILGVSISSYIGYAPLRVQLILFSLSTAFMPHLALLGVITSISGTLFLIRSTSAFVIDQYLPFFRTLYGLLVLFVAMNPEFVAKPSKVALSIFFTPWLPPIKTTSMNIPEKTPKAVKKLRVLLRVIVIKISSHLSKSILILICSKCFNRSNHDCFASWKESS